MKTNSAKWLVCAVGAAVALATAVYAQQAPDASQGKKSAGTTSSAAPKAAVPAAGATAANTALIAQGKARYQAYKCFDCHGQNGEGTDDAPDLIGTRKTEAEIAKFLQKPSADAIDKGMPDIAATSADLKPLVAYVVSLKKKN